MIDKVEEGEGVGEGEKEAEKEIEKGKEKEKDKEEGRALRNKLKTLLREVRVIEKAEKIQGRIVAKKRTNTTKAKLKGKTKKSVERLKSREDGAREVFKRIRDAKKRAEAELKETVATIKKEEMDLGWLALTGGGVGTEVAVPEPEEIADKEIDSSDSDFYFGTKEVGVLETYPINVPYSSITIESTTPPTYKVSEVTLTRGEEELLKGIKSRLYETIDVSMVNIEDPIAFLQNKINENLAMYSLSLDPDIFDKILYYLKRDVVGYGKLDPIINDSMTEDISVDGPGIPLYVYHRKHGSIPTNVSFEKEELDSMVYKLSQRSGRHISLAKPLLDATLPTGDRIQLSIGDEVTTKGSTFTIRKFKAIPITPIDLINFKTFSVEMMAYLWMAVENGKNILIAGGTATGKTTVLNSLAMFIPSECKIVSIEDTREINILHQNWIPAVTREVEEGGHTIEMFDLLRSALRQRPEYILVGEVRGKEAYTLFQAMATGHVTFSTTHADSAEAVVKRLTKPPIDVPLMLLDSLDIICIQKMVKLGTERVRRCSQIVEVTGINFDAGTLKTNTLFRWTPADVFEFTGESNVFSEIMDMLNIDEDQLSSEFNNRIKVLKWLQKKKMGRFENIARTIFEYTRNPSGLMELIKKDEDAL
jgi:flagellar protein FlaI